MQEQKRLFVCGDYNFNQILVTAHGSFTLGADGGYTQISVQAEKRAFRIGDVLPDGWTVGPISPDTGIVMAIEPEDSALPDDREWHEGKIHALELRFDGKNLNARVPTELEATAIFNQVVKAGLNRNSQLVDKRERQVSPGNTQYANPNYWTSGTGKSGYRNFAMRIDMSNGSADTCPKTKSAGRVRCVRDEPGIELIL